MDILEYTLKNNSRACAIAKRDSYQVQVVIPCRYWWQSTTTSQHRTLSARMFTLFELKNGWIVPITLLVQNEQLLIAHYVGYHKTNPYRSNSNFGEIGTPTTLGTLQQDVQALYDK